MLKFFRKKNIAKMVFWGLLILILPAFVLWGTGSLSRPKEKGPSFVGIIDKKKVSFNEFFENLTAMRTLLILNYFNQPQILDAFLKNKPLLAKLAWDRLVMLKEAKKYKIKIPDKDVINYIRSHPLFLRNGKFDDKIYGYVLQYNMGLNPRSFEEMIRSNLEVQGLNEVLTKDLNITDEEVRTEYKKDYEKFKISYVLIETKSYLDKINIDAGMIKDYYEKHKNEFILPAKEGAETRLANFEDVKASIKDYLAEKEARILALKNAEELYKKITEFTTAKKETFEAAVSKLELKARETPFFSGPDYIEGLGEAASLVGAATNLKPNEISNPIETRKGALIFKVSALKGIDEEAFKKDKEVFAKKVWREKRAKMVDGWFNEIAARSFLNIDLKDIEKYYR